MSKSFLLIEQFLQDAYDLNFSQPLNKIISSIKELKIACEIIINIIKEYRKPTITELILLFPLLKVSFTWSQLKLDKSRDNEKFLKRIIKRLKNDVDQGNFYGTIFEIDMASRCLLSNWTIEFIEKNPKGTKQKQIEFLFIQDGRVIGIECLSKRYGADDLTIEKINSDIEQKASKFKHFNTKLDERLLIIDVTTSDFSKPKILDDIGNLHRKHLLEAVIFTYTLKENAEADDDFSLIEKYESFGDVENRYFTTTYATEIRKGPIIFIRKYVEPEPTHEVWGPEENIKDYH